MPIMFSTVEEPNVIRPFCEVPPRVIVPVVMDEPILTTPPLAVNPPTTVSAPSEVSLFKEEKNCISPVPPPPCNTKELVVVALICGFVPPRIKFPLVSAVTCVPVADCEGKKPPTVVALIEYPDEKTRCRGLNVWNVTPEHDKLTCAATSTFK